MLRFAIRHQPEMLWVMSPKELQPVRLIQDQETGDHFLMYATERGVKVELRYEGDDIWLSQDEIAAVFGVERSVVTKHIGNIYDEDELEAAATSAKIARVRTEGGRQVRRQIEQYNLDVIIAVGYRVGSKQGALFRRWATDKLVRFATRGFVVDVERLKNPAEHDRFTELRRLIQDIRAAEANVYAELRRILALCKDYEPKSRQSQLFFANFQNKLHFAVTSHTAAELVVARADAQQPNMGLTNWPGDEIRQQDAVVAKCYLGQAEIDELNRATNMLLDYFDDQVQRQRLVSMDEAAAKLDDWLRFNQRPVLRDFGKVTAKKAEDHARYKIFDGQRRAARKVEADRNLVRALDQQTKAIGKPRRKKE
jgi:hypothetical protein